MSRPAACLCMTMSILASRRGIPSCGADYRGARTCRGGLPRRPPQRADGDLHAGRRDQPACQARHLALPVAGALAWVERTCPLPVSLTRDQCAPVPEGVCIALPGCRNRGLVWRLCAPPFKEYQSASKYLHHNAEGDGCRNGRALASSSARSTCRWWAAQGGRDRRPLASRSCWAGARLVLRVLRVRAFVCSMLHNMGAHWQRLPENTWAAGLVGGH